MPQKKIIKVERLPDSPSKIWRGRVFTNDGTSYEVYDHEYEGKNFEEVIHTCAKTDDLFLVEINRGKPGIQIAGSEAARDRFYQDLRRNKPSGSDAVAASGAKQVIDELAKRQRRRGQMAVVSVIKYPLTHPPRVVANILLQDGTSYDLTEDAFGKKNYELTISSDRQAEGDALYCVASSTAGKKLVLVGTEAGAKRVQ